MLKRIEEVLPRAEAPVFALLRFITGFLMTFHGMQKLFGWLSTHPSPPAGSQLWIGGVLELSCGVLVALGLLTRPAAFLASGMMAVAYFQFHWKFAFDDFKWLPIVNMGELAVVYCFVFLYIFVHGAGIASLDDLISRRRTVR